jgi:prepilin-type N-terminal cleavage/methylation domain-containing protein
MKLVSDNLRSHACRRAFTLVELMVAASIGVILAGTAVLLLIQAATEQQRGYSDTTLEERAYTLQANITSWLRSGSSSLGMQPNSATGDDTVGYTSIYVFTPNADGSALTTSQISADLVSGAVVYTRDTSAPANQALWMTNSPGVVLRKLNFKKSANLDGSPNANLVNVIFQMDDNGFSRQNATNNVADIERSFSVQMRAD